MGFTADTEPYYDIVTYHEEEVYIITIKEFAEKADINYSTCRKYVNRLKERNAFEEPTEEWVEVVQDIYSFTKRGEKLDDAIDKALGKERDKSDSEMLHELYNKVEELERTNKQLSDMNQVYLSRINEISTKLDNVQKALPAPNEGLWKSFLRLIGIRPKQKKEGS